MQFNSGWLRKLISRKKENEFKHCKCQFRPEPTAKRNWYCLTSKMFTFSSFASFFQLSLNTQLHNFNEENLLFYINQCCWLNRLVRLNLFDIVQHHSSRKSLIRKLIRHDFEWKIVITERERNGRRRNEKNSEVNWHFSVETMQSGV